MSDECEADTLELDDIAEAIQASLEATANERIHKRQKSNPNRADNNWNEHNRDCPARSNKDTNRRENERYQRQNIVSNPPHKSSLKEKCWVLADEINKRNNNIDVLPPFVDERSRILLLNAAKHELNAAMIVCAVCDRLYLPS